MKMATACSVLKTKECERKNKLSSYNPKSNKVKSSYNSRFDQRSFSKYKINTFCVAGGVFNPENDRNLKAAYLFIRLNQTHCSNRFK